MLKTLTAPQESVFDGLSFNCSDAPNESIVYDGAHKRLQKVDSFDKNLNSQNATLIPPNANLISPNANLILLMQT